MKIAIYGSGGVGGYFGARLAAAGNEVHFLARGAHLRAMREQGLRVESALGNLQIKVLAHERPEEIGAVDYVVFAVKLADVESAAERLRPLLHERTLVLCFQNGVEAPETVARVIGAQHARSELLGRFVYLRCCRAGARRRGAVEEDRLAPVSEPRPQVHGGRA